MIQILMLKNPLFRKGLSVPQRIAYLSSSLFWLFPLTRITFILAPLLYIFFSLEIYEANLSEFIAYVGVYMAANMMMQNYLYGRVRWPWMSELYEYVQSVYLIRSIVGVVLNPRKPTFNVTAKGLTLHSNQLSEYALSYYAVFFILLIAAITNVLRWLREPGAGDLAIVVGLWNFFNLVMAGLALGVVSERAERRKAQRLRIARRGAVMVNGKIEQVLIEDVSMGGVKIRPLSGRFSAEYVSGRRGYLAVAPAVHGQSIMHAPVEIGRLNHEPQGVIAGLTFSGDGEGSLINGVVSNLMYASAQPLGDFRERRRDRIGVMFGSIRLIGLSVYHTLRGCYYLAFHRQVPAAPILPPPAPPISAIPVQERSA